MGYSNYGHWNQECWNHILLVYELKVFDHPVKAQETVTSQARELIQAAASGLTQHSTQAFVRGLSDQVKVGISWQFKMNPTDYMNWSVSQIMITDCVKGKEMGLLLPYLWFWTCLGSSSTTLNLQQHVHLVLQRELRLLSKFHSLAFGQWHWLRWNSTWLVEDWTVGKVVDSYHKEGTLWGSWDLQTFTDSSVGTTASSYFCETNLWSTEAATAFVRLKKLPILMNPKSSHQFILEVNASEDGVCATEGSLWLEASPLCSLLMLLASSRAWLQYW